MQKEDKYALVGAAYVHGIMYGESAQSGVFDAAFRNVVLV